MPFERKISSRIFETEHMIALLLYAVGTSPMCFIVLGKQQV